MILKSNNISSYSYWIMNSVSEVEYIKELYYHIKENRSYIKIIIEYSIDEQFQGIINCNLSIKDNVDIDKTKVYTYEDYYEIILFEIDALHTIIPINKSLNIKQITEEVLYDHNCESRNIYIRMNGLQEVPYIVKNYVYGQIIEYINTKYKNKI